MKQKLTFLILAILMVLNVQAQETDEKVSAGLILNLDAFFGFTPMMTFGYSLSDTDAVTAYGIQWGAGTGSAWGQWTEVGIGYNKTVGNFDINPQLGFTMGSLLSSGAAQEGVIGDGIVPNLTVNYSSEKFEGQFYFGYYAALTDNTQSENATNNYVHYWANFGYKVSPYFSFGAHYEELYLSGGSINGGGDLDRLDGYQWIGPYLQVQKGNAGLRFSFGANNVGDDGFAQNDFYKLAFFMTL
jgi:hypothetical protein